ncbi:MAG TPA: hypothetical protein VGA96_07660 [Fibrella sp.]
MTTAPPPALSQLTLTPVGNSTPATYLLRTPSTSFYVRESV